MNKIVIFIVVALVLAFAIAKASALAIFDKFKNPNALKLVEPYNFTIQKDGKLKPVISSQLSTNFNQKEFTSKENHGKRFLIAEPLIELLQAVRNEWKKPLKVNSGFRTQQQQDALKAKGYRTAKYSPHVAGMAADIDTTSAIDTIKLRSLVLRKSKELAIPVRLGHTQYAKLGQTFLHIDVTPVYYGEGKPYNHLEHPSAWAKPYLEW